MNIVDASKKMQMGHVVFSLKANCCLRARNCDLRLMEIDLGRTLEWRWQPYRSFRVDHVQIEDWHALPLGVETQPLRRFSPLE